MTHNEKTSPHEGPLGFYVNLDERGDFYADLRDEGGNTVFEIRSEEDGSIALIEDGYMRHKGDLSGLQSYLADIGVIAARAEILDVQTFEACLDDIPDPEV